MKLTRSTFAGLAIAVAASTSAGCITVSGVDVGGVNANASIRANTTVSGNKVTTEGANERATPAPSRTTPKPNATTAPTPQPEATPSTGTTPVLSELNDVAAALNVLVQDELDASLYSNLVRDPGLISSNSGGYHTLYLTQPLPQFFVKARADRNQEAKRLSQANRNVSNAERDALSKAISTAPWIGMNDGTERKIAELTITYNSGGANLSRQVKLEQIRLIGDMMTVDESVTLIQSKDGVTRTSTRTMTVKEDGSETIGFKTVSTGGNVIAPGGGGYHVRSVTDMSAEWTCHVPLTGAISGNGTCVLADKTSTITWAGTGFNPVGKLETEGGRLQISLPLDGQARVVVDAFISGGNIIAAGSGN